MTSRTTLILGAGPRIGWSVASKFKHEGYQVAIASRNPDISKATSAGFLPISTDVTNVQSVEAAFSQVSQELGVPNVVVYNCAALTFPSNLSDPFNIPTQNFVNDLGVNLTGGYAAMSQAVKGFKVLSPEVPEVFIATGNVLPFKPHLAGVTLGSGKAGLAHLINIGSQAYSESNYRFYFASQVTEDGNAVQNPDVSASAHASLYLDLVNQKEQGEWDVRFLHDGRVVSNKE